MMIDETRTTDIQDIIIMQKDDDDDDDDDEEDRLQFIHDSNFSISLLLLGRQDHHINSVI